MNAKQKKILDDAADAAYRDLDAARNGTHGPKKQLTVAHAQINMLLNAIEMAFREETE